MKYIIFILSLSGAVISHRGGEVTYPESTGQEKTKYLYVGAEACATKCHNSDTMGFQFNIWKTSSHSGSFESLKTDKALNYAEKAGAGEKPWENMICLKCHITAAGLDTSSLAPTYKKEDGVTCEACHKGEFMTKTFVPGEADCLTCHNSSAHPVSAFDFNERCKKISHLRPKTKSE